MNQSKKWALGHTLILIILCIDVAIVGIWLLFYFHKYKAIATVVGGIWAAILALLGAFGIKSQKGFTLTRLLELKPIKVIVYTYTLLIGIALVLFLLWEFPSHWVKIIPDSSQQEISFRIELTNDKTNEPYIEYDLIKDDGFWARKGVYKLTVSPQPKEKYEHREKIIMINWWELIKEIPINEFQQREGKLLISHSPYDLDLVVKVVENDKIGEEVFKTKIKKDDDFSRNLPPGKYQIEANAKGFKSKIDPIEIMPGKSFEYPIKLEKEIGTLFLDPDQKGMKIRIDDKAIDGLTPLKIQLSPGKHKIELLKSGNSEQHGYYHEEVISIRVDEVLNITPQLNQINLSELQISPQNVELKSVYYLHDQFESKSLGRIIEDRRFYVFPGKYRLEKQTPSGESLEETFTIEKGKTRKVNF